MRSSRSGAGEAKKSGAYPVPSLAVFAHSIPSYENYRSKFLELVGTGGQISVVGPTLRSGVCSIERFHREEKGVNACTLGDIFYFSVLGNRGLFSMASVGAIVVALNILIGL